MISERRVDSATECSDRVIPTRLLSAARYVSRASKARGDSRLVATTPLNLLNTLPTFFLVSLSGRVQRARECIRLAYRPSDLHSEPEWREAPESCGTDASVRFAPSPSFSGSVDEFRRRRGFIRLFAVGLPSGPAEKRPIFPRDRAERESGREGVGKRERERVWRRNRGGGRYVGSLVFDFVLTCRHYGIRFGQPPVEKAPSWSWISITVVMATAIDSTGVRADEENRGNHRESVTERGASPGRKGIRGG